MVEWAAAFRRWRGYGALDAVFLVGNGVAGAVKARGFRLIAFVDVAGLEVEGRSRKTDQQPNFYASHGRTTKLMTSTLLPAVEA